MPFQWIGVERREVDDQIEKQTFPPSFHSLLTQTRKKKKQDECVEYFFFRYPKIFTMYFSMKFFFSYSIILLFVSGDSFSITRAVIILISLSLYLSPVCFVSIV